MRHSRLILALLCGAPATAQVFIVDEANGPGTDFTDIPPAVAMVPDGATLRVRAGSYTPFEVAGKGIRVVGEGAVSIVGAGAVVIRQTRSDQAVVLRGLELPFSTTTVTDTLGPVLVEDCRSPVLSPRSVLSATRAANLHLHRCAFGSTIVFLSNSGPAVRVEDTALQLSGCQLIGGPGSQAFSGRGTPGFAALTAQGGRCLIVDSTLTGGAGGPGCRTCGIGCSADGGHGGPGLTAVGATVLALAAELRGGRGGNGASCGGQSTCPGDGGAGAEITNSQLYVIASVAAGGLAGAGGCGAVSGPRLLQTGGNVVEDASAPGPSAEVIGTQQRGQTIEMTLTEPSAQTTVLLLSYAADLIPLEPFLWGSLLATPAFVSAPIAPSGGVARLRWTLPASLPLGEVYHGQFVTLGPNGLGASNSFPILATH